MLANETVKSATLMKATDKADETVPLMSCGVDGHCTGFAN